MNEKAHISVPHRVAKSHQAVFMNVEDKPLEITA